MINLRKTIICALVIALLSAFGIICYLTGKVHGRCEVRQEINEQEWVRIRRADSILTKRSEIILDLMGKYYHD